MYSIHRAHAEQLLGQLRDCPKNYREAYSTLMDTLYDGGVALEDIDTTRETLTAILENCREKWSKIDAQYWRHEAHYWWEQLKDNPAAFEPVIPVMDKAMEKAGMETYEELEKGATKRIPKLIQEGIWDRIDRVLVNMRRRHPDQRSDHAIALRRLLGLGGLSAEEAGTSQEELDRALGVVRSSEH